MPLTPFSYDYPERLVALQPEEPCRILHADKLSEINMQQLIELFHPGDLLVINNSKVLKRRIITQSGLEILFLDSYDDDRKIWQVLFPARGLKVADEISLPDGLRARLKAKGIPQLLEFDQAIREDYFQQHAELALPPYIQQARGERHNRPEDEAWYQTAWAKQAGSIASPTASLHFSNQDLQILIEKGIAVEEVTLHVGAGTFLPIRTDKLEEHKMHSEWAEISEATVEKLKATKARGGRVWALGTTACRTIESFGQDLLEYQPDAQLYCGPTSLFIYPGYQWNYVSGLLTNFHQPRTTLLALVESFAGRDSLAKAYDYAVQNEFRLFSYGDLSVWTRKA